MASRRSHFSLREMQCLRGADSSPDRVDEEDSSAWEPSSSDDKIKWAKVFPTYTKTYPDAKPAEVSHVYLLIRLRDKNPLEVFEMIFTDQMITHIVLETVLYSRVKKDHSFEFSNDCFKKFMGILLLTGCYHSLPHERCYWSELSGLKDNYIRRCMSYKRYQEIKEYLLFNNKRCPRLEWIRSFFYPFNKSFMQFGVFSKELTIDELCVTYYQGSGICQRLCTNENRFGFKQWLMCDSRLGYCYQMDVYHEKLRNPENNVERIPLREDAILKMISVLERPEVHKIYLGLGPFTRHSLITRLNEMNIRAMGICMKTDRKYSTIKTDKGVRSTKNGAFDYRFDPANEILGVTWISKDCCFRLLTNHGQVLPLVENRDRRNGLLRREIVTNQPNVASEFLLNGMGVSEMGIQVKKCRSRMTGRKWFFSLMTHAIDVAVVNAWLLYSLVNDPVPLSDFKRLIATACMFGPFSGPIPRDLRLATKHFTRRAKRISAGENKRNCEICGSSVRPECRKCNVELNKTCF